MKNERIQIRAIGSLESEGQTRQLSGYAIRFNEQSSELYDIWSGVTFRETILPEAITPEFLAAQDIRVLYNHNADGLSLARWNKGEGSLELTVDEQGVFFRFSAPETPFGNEILDAVRRGDVDRCSFAFFVSPKDVTETKADDGIYERTVHKILAITEISLLDVQPAYSSTSIDNRSNENLSDNMEENKIIEDLQEKINELEDKLKNLEPAESTEDENREDPVDPEEEESLEDAPEEEPVEEPEEERAEEDPAEEEIDEESKEEIKEEKMNKQNFSLIKAIRSIVNTGKLDPISQAVSDLGAQEMRAAGLASAGQIHLPVNSRSNEITVSAEGEDVIITEWDDILEPLRANNVLADAGAKIMTGLVGDLQVPVMNGGNVGWAGEIAAASAAGTTFDHVLLQPKRLTAFVDISKQFIAQDALGAEEMIREDLVKAIQSKLESTILGTAAGDTTKPAGIFYNVSPTTISDFTDITELESDLEDANFNGNFKYILSPKAKASMRSMIKGTNATGMVFESGEVDGTPALVTTNMATKTFAVGDWSNLAIGQWSSVDLTVDPFSQAANGVVRIVINAFFDAKVLREDAFAYGTFE